ncbi:hypothetical protein M0R45_019580 [Rubus argutus]|uniref:ABC-type xenobiotic transporter n=1 Tax=Rubus argutus TaxID=59490 RepID=A0AAW1X8J5_RUBAR
MEEGDPKEGFRNSQTLYYRHTLICCLGVSATSLVFCVLYYFSWYRYGWSEEKLVTLSDLAIRTLSWGAVFVYLHTQFSNSGESKFPYLLRVWWGFYFSLSCYCLVIDFVLYQKDVSLPIQSLVSDVAFLIAALFFIYVGFIGKKEERDTLLEDPLLNGTRNTSIGNTEESSKPKGDETVKAPYSNAGIFSILTFSWLSPLIAVGKKKTLDHEDVPELDKSDSVLGSAVDAHTGSHLFKECLMGLLSSKTVIYVTHQVEFLPAADIILVMKDGRITQSGKFNDILNSGTDFMDLVGAHNEALSTLDSIGKEPVETTSINEEDSNSASTNGTVQKLDNRDVQDSKPEDLGVPKGQLVQEEEREKGKVGFSVYWKYITTAYRGALVPFILLAQILFQLLQIGSNYWMAWATPVSTDLKPAVASSTLIIVYVALSVGSSFCVLFRALLLATAGYKTATILFNKMHLCIFRAPMSFFDATPSGRILNRASTDQNSVDLNIPNRVAGVAFSMIRLLGIIAVMSQVAWQVFIIFIPVVTACVLYQQYYISSARELARLIGVCKAPVIQHFSETISGSATIRSFDQESKFRDTNMKLMDGYCRPMFYSDSAMEWLCFRLDMLSSIAFAFSLIFLISVPEGVINPGIAGLAVTYGLNLNILQAQLIWSLCNMENKIISVERILQYTTSLPSEPPLVIECNRPDHSWPSQGKIDMHDLQVRYAPHLPLVLRGLTCTFPGGMKTGIVGRTGSGKSTLIQTLFRIVDPAAGRILIDGIDISSIGLHDLRSRLSIIPQDPTMFEGTVRSNLDPLEEYTDEQIWEALDKCQLGDEVRKKEGKLDSAVSENGENWSMGQRQLVCLGRVLLKKSKVLVLDEATASVDTATDTVIQQTLRQHFSDCTVITIAHRITSVLDSDVVLLLSHGLIEECDSPARLLENKLSSFAQLVAEYTMRSNSSLE